MDDYMNWRNSQGLAPLAPKYPKRTRPMYLSDQGFEGLQKIAENLNVVWGNKPSVSNLMESIGLGLYIVYNAKQDKGAAYGEEYVDPDGLSTKQCYELGKDDWQNNRPMALSTSALAGGRKRSPVFVQAYIAGYTSGFIDQESIHEATDSMDDFASMFSAFTSNANAEDSSFLETDAEYPHHAASAADDDPLGDDE